MTLLVDAQEDLAPPKPMPRHKGHWLWGGTFDFKRNPAEFLLEAHEEYGDVFVTRVLTGSSYFIRDPEVVNAINVTHAKHIYKPKVVKQMWKPFLGNGLVPNDGESWKRQHKLIMPGFHKMRVDAYAPTMGDYTRDMIRAWKDGEQRDFRDETRSASLRRPCSTRISRTIPRPCTMRCKPSWRR
jgi:cytochrome P450